uniref:hypothetical protein n=1 Tax=Wolbachia endosymbiont of Atemnus politus TaxID=2682840 RepID=UPI001C5537B2|nr:hypothetical protein [Wolbachia endosymbiont of Atemnus politus]
MKTVQSIMQKNSIRAILRRKFKTNKQKQTNNRAVAPNILDQNFIVQIKTDITYIKTKEGFGRTHMSN